MMTLPLIVKSAFNVAHDSIQQSGNFRNIYFAYKFILTLPCTQVTCERTFSKLNNKKTKLRSTVCQDTMESNILINIERDFVIDKNLIINNIGKSSKLLSKLLF